MSMAILKGGISEREAFVVAWSGFILALLMGIFLVLHRGWPIVLLGLIGFIGGYFYTPPPLQYKYRALGLPLVFLLMGPLMVVGSYFAVTGSLDANLLVVSPPVGVPVACTAPSVCCCSSGWSRDRQSAEARHRRPGPGRGRLDSCLPRATVAVLAADVPRGRRPGCLRAGHRTGHATGTAPAAGFCDRARVSGRALCDLPGRRPHGTADHAGRRSRGCRDLPGANAGPALRP